MTWQRSVKRPEAESGKPRALGVRFGSAFQYKGLFPAIDEASRVSFAYRAASSSTWSARSPARPATAAGCATTPPPCRFRGQTIGELGELPLGDAGRRFDELEADARREQKIAGELLREITSRLQFLVDVGLDYLTLGRPAPTLSGGEAQRIRLASQIGSGLSGVLYVLDEPTIGLHPRDNRRLLEALHKLRDLGNTLVSSSTTAK